MPDKEEIKLKPTANPMKDQPFFASSLKKDNGMGYFSLVESGVPTPVVNRTTYGITAIVYFDKDSIFMNGQNYAVVQKLSNDLMYLHNPKVIVDGHASQEGSEEHNKQLSESRRFGVIAILNSTKKVTPINYEGKAYGESQPALPETGKTKAEKENQRKYNRRVEINILFDPSTIKKKEEKKKKLIDLNYKPTPEDQKRWEQEELNRRLWQTPYVPPHKKKSLNDLLWNKFDEAVDKALRKLNVPEKLRPYIKKVPKKQLRKAPKLF